MTGNLGWRRFKTWCSRFWYWARISAPSSCVVAQTDKKMPFPLPGWYRHKRSLLPWAKIRALLVSASPTARGTLLQLEHCPRLQGTLPVALGHLLCHGIPFVRASLLSPHLLCHGTSAPLPHTAPDTRQRGISRRVGQVHPCQGEREGRDPKEGCHAALPAPCSLPASVLQGFQCSQAHQLPAATVLALAREMRNKSVELSSAQVGRGGCWGGGGITPPRCG